MEWDEIITPESIFAFVIGYFALWSPIWYAIDGSLIKGLLTGIVGLGITNVLIWRFWK